jgi:hypothetical protein
VALGAAGTVFVMKSSKGMGYEDVIELLEHPGKPEHHRRSALFVINGHLQDCIGVLQQIRAGDPNGALGAVAQGQLKALKEFLDSGKGNLPMIVDEDLEEAAKEARNVKLSLEQRKEHLTILAGLAASGIQAMQTIPNVTEGISLDLKNYMTRLRISLSQ